MTEPRDDALSALLEKVPESIRPVVIEYGPALLKMGKEELWEWIKLLLNGRNREAYRVVLQKMSNAELSTEWDRLDAKWQAANVANREDVELQKAALNALLKALLMVAVALVGL